MKKFYLLIFLFYSLYSAYNQTPITLTFKAKDSLTQNPLALDSVNIKNLTKTCDTTLYDSVSVLDFVALWPVGIDEPASHGSESLVMMQPVPNPFQGSTLVQIWLKNDGELNLAIDDNKGKILSQYHNRFEKGWHLFSVSANGSALMFLKADDNTTEKTIKLLCSGPGSGGNRISYQGQAGKTSKSLKSSADGAGFIYYLGNQLQYTAYKGGYQESILMDNPVTSETYTFAMFSPVFICGSSITINHVAGAVAPVNKTVTYGTVTNIPGEPSKCWITSNLGADHQATAKSDATEASAGWYWQFNLKQGYKHTGSVRTPNTTWIDPIDENSDWMPANDPCTLELGNGWRIPTQTEWHNVVLSGNWANWNGPWNSGLKLHAAGYLLNIDGSLHSRGSQGYCWSSTQGDNHESWCLEFYSSMASSQNISDKALGFSARCLKEPGTSTIPTVSTSPVIDITPSTATSGGNVTADGGAPVTARGVCWSTTPTPTTAGSHTTDGSGIGSFVSNLTGLTPNTPYYVRAYATNSVGTAYGDELNFTTLPAAFTCGSSIIIYHVAGAVAPVDKTVTYGTVTNIPGEPSKCWITSNLGADHQAMAKDDATEPSAGWYWQFNHKQGYKHDGTTRTPNTPWIQTINEDSDWTSANDPCTLEMGSGWRIPTETELTNVTAIGGWTNWNGPWNSALQMHAAGYLLDYSNGALSERGTNGYYWSSAQVTNLHADGRNLGFGSGACQMMGGFKAWGQSIRCIKD